MKSALDKIARFWRDGHSLSDPVISLAVNELKYHSSFFEAVNRLSSPDRKLSYHELTDDSDRRISVACSSDNWTVSVVMDYIVGGDITVSPYPIIIAPANGARLEIDLYEFSCEDFSRSFSQNLRLGVPQGRKTIGDGEFWATPARGVFADVVSVAGGEDGREPVIMVVTGEAYAPYVRVFDRSGNLASTVFSSNKFNGQQFFGDFLKNVTGSDFVNYMSDQERQNLLAFVADQISDPSEIVSEALWPMVQTAANLDRTLGLQALKNLANSSHEMASHASAILARQSIDMRTRSNA